jgi:heme/copper-type cytochrome/quinol oxidase subunit 3
MTTSAVAEREGARIARFGMWVFLVTDALSFAALLAAYATLRARAESWAHIGTSLPLAAVAAAALFASSLTLMRGRVGATLALGVAFLGAQAFEWIALLRHGGTGELAASLFIVTTGWHGLHVVAGLIVLALFRRSPAAALFWQFVDAVWVVLFTAFYLAPAVPTAAAIALGVVAAAGFAAIVFFPMNLRGESRAVKVVFVLPLVLPILFTVAVVADAATRGIRP